jgi:hypothetical protein
LHELEADPLDLVLAEQEPKVHVLVSAPPPCRRAPHRLRGRRHRPPCARPLRRRGPPLPCLRAGRLTPEARGDRPHGAARRRIRRSWGGRGGRLKQEGGGADGWGRGGRLKQEGGGGAARVRVGRGAVYRQVVGLDGPSGPFSRCCEPKIGPRQI